MATQYHLSSESLLALPYISILVGIDDLTPTKAAFVVCDAPTTSLQFVHGNGTFVVAQQVRFDEGFLNNNRDYFHEVMNRSILYIQMINEVREFRKGVQREYLQFTRLVLSDSETY